MPEMKSPKLQNIRIRRPNAESHIETKASLQISQTVSFAAITEHQVVPVYNATWEFKEKNLESCPLKGDVIIDANGAEWQVQKAANITHRNIRQCRAYLELTESLPIDSVNIVRAYAVMSPDARQMTTAWQRVKSNISAKLVTEDVAKHRKTKAKNNLPHLRAYIREHLSLQKNDFVELPDGRQYKITRTRNSRPMHGWNELFLTANTRPVVVVEQPQTL